MIFGRGQGSEGNREPLLLPDHIDADDDDDGFTSSVRLCYPNCHHFSQQSKCFALNRKSRSGTGTHLSEQRRCSSAHGGQAAHTSMLASVGTAFKVRHFLRSLGDATKLLDSDRVRFAEPEGVICLICFILVGQSGATFSTSVRKSAVGFTCRILGRGAQRAKEAS